MNLIGLAGCDRTLLEKVSRRERRWIATVGLNVLFNSTLIGFSILTALASVGNERTLAFGAGFAGGLWYLNFQRLILLLHGPRRAKWTSVFSRLFVALLLMLVHVLAGMGLLHLRPASLQLEHFFCLFALLAIAPLYLRSAILRNSDYQRLLEEQQQSLVAAWTLDASRRYSQLVAALHGAEYDNHKLPG